MIFPKYFLKGEERKIDSKPQIFDDGHSLIEPQLARNGSARRIALWQLGVAAPGKSVPGGVQLALALYRRAPDA